MDITLGTLSLKLKIVYRGIWHMSPFFKDLMLCDKVLNHFEKIIGEPVFPHMYLYNAAQMNVGKVGADGPVDQWHFDSVNYVAVTLLSDITDMKVNFYHINTLK